MIPFTALLAVVLFYAPVSMAGPEGISTTSTSAQPSGLRIQEIEIGNGPGAALGDAVAVIYSVTLENGKEVASSHHRPFRIRLGSGEVIPGLERGIIGMKTGGKRRIAVPPALAYGDRATGQIPQGASLIFEVSLLRAESPRAQPVNQACEGASNLRVAADREEDAFLKPYVKHMMESMRKEDIDGLKTLPQELVIPYHFALGIWKDSERILKAAGARITSFYRGRKITSRPEIGSRITLGLWRALPGLTPAKEREALLARRAAAEKELCLTEADEKKCSDTLGEHAEALRVCPSDRAENGRLYEFKVSEAGELLPSDGGPQALAGGAGSGECYSSLYQALPWAFSMSRKSRYLTAYPVSRTCRISNELLRPQVFGKSYAFFQGAAQVRNAHLPEVPNEGYLSDQQYCESDLDCHVAACGCCPKQDFNAVNTYHLRLWYQEACGQWFACSEVLCDRPVLTAKCSDHKCTLYLKGFPWTDIVLKSGL